MKISSWLKRAENKLIRAGIGTARLDSLVLLEDCLNKNRTHFLAHPDLLLSLKQQNWLDRQIALRATHIPLAYIRGKTEFYRREFIVDKRVLEPRPESETMIEFLKSMDHPDGTRILDLGTGSGALGITAKLELPNVIVDITDIDENALAVADQNIRKYNIKVASYVSDLFDKVKDPYQIIMANLPYVPDNYHINPAAQAEPRIAIYGGGDGLDLYRRMFKQMESLRFQPTVVLTESLPPQHDILAAIAEESGYRLDSIDDFIQKFIKV
jgi:release factor glutamine methyltransferase